MIMSEARTIQSDAMALNVFFMIISPLFRYSAALLAGSAQARAQEDS